MKDLKIFTKKGCRKEITIKLGLKKAVLLNDLCRANQISPKDVFLIGMEECFKRGCVINERLPNDK